MKLQTCYFFPTCVTRVQSHDGLHAANNSFKLLHDGQKKLKLKQKLIQRKAEMKFKEVWGELPPNLKNLVASNGGRMYFSRALYWAKDHWRTTAIMKKVTDKKPRRATSDTPKNLVKLRP